MSEQAPRREANKADKAARIRAATRALLEEVGFDAMTTRQVAERAEIATGTLYLYVKTKEELVDFLFRGEIAAVVEQAFATLPAGKLADRLGHVYGALLRFYARDVALARTLLKVAMFAPIGSPGMQLTIEFLGRLARLVAEAQRAGEVDPSVDPFELTMSSFSLYLGGVLGVANQMADADGAHARVRRSIEVHLRGVRPVGEKPRGVRPVGEKPRGVRRATNVKRRPR